MKDSAMPTPDPHEPVIRPIIDRLADLIPEEQRPAAIEYMLQLLREDPSILHISLPLAAYVIQQNPEDWQQHLEVAPLVAECRQLGDFVRMLGAVPPDGRAAQAEYLAGVATEIKTKLWGQT